MTAAIALKWLASHRKGIDLYSNIGCDLKPEQSKRKQFIHIHYNIIQRLDFFDALVLEIVMRQKESSTWEQLIGHSILSEYQMAFDVNFSNGK